MANKCGSCRFYSAGECRKTPPTRLPRKFDASAAAGNRVRNEALIWGWPEVTANDWCGDHAETSPSRLVEVATLAGLAIAIVAGLLTFLTPGYD